MDELSVEIFNSLVGKDIKIIGERKEEYEGEDGQGHRLLAVFIRTEILRPLGNPRQDIRKSSGDNRTLPPSGGSGFRRRGAHPA